jgi:hypothetical protein
MMQEVRMAVTLIGALLVLGGLVFLMAQPIWNGRLSVGRRASATTPEPTLEPSKPGAGFSLKENWPGLALMALGGLLLLVVW